MQFNYRYPGDSTVSSTATSTAMSFAPDTLRKPTFFSGKLSQNIAFREAISALHDVVISDVRFQPKDKTAYKEWAARREMQEMAELVKDQPKLATRILEMDRELTQLSSGHYKRMVPYYNAQRAYFNYIYKKDYNAWYVLDPVITVHPDQLFFECFSKDESSYGMVTCGYDVFKEMDDYACGTTNVDYSSELYDEFRKIRDYKDTRFEIDPSGFQVETEGAETHKEVKIDLPESWVRGFLQVSAAMTLPSTRVRLHPMDIYNFCFLLRQRKEKHGPRSMRFVLKPGQPVTVVFEPWDYKLVCARSIYEGKKEEEIRIWGRRRLHILERLIPVAKHFTLYLAGTGMPSFYVADLGDIRFTLGLSGWTANDWSKAGNFDLMAPRGEVDDYSRQQIFNHLKENWAESADALSKRLKVDRTMVLASLFGYAQAGMVLYDQTLGVYRVRELTRDPLPVSQLRFASPREKEAGEFIERKQVKLTKARTDEEGNQILEGKVEERRRRHLAELVIDKDKSLVRGKCTCDFYIHNKLYKGPCSHMLAIRMFFQKKLDGKRFRLW